MFGCSWLSFSDSYSNSYLSLVFLTGVSHIFCFSFLDTSCGPLGIVLSLHSDVTLGDLVDSWGARD